MGSQAGEADGSSLRLAAMGARRLISWLLVRKLAAEFSLRALLLGWENAVLRLSSMDRRAIVPVLRRHGARIGRGCDFESGVVFHNCQDFSRLSIGDDCHIGKRCLLDLRSTVTLGDRVTVSMNCSLITHLDCGRSALGEAYPPETRAVVLEDDVYLGCGATVLMGGRIGRGALVAAGAVVRGDVQPRVLVAGVPAVAVGPVRGGGGAVSP